MAGYLLEIDVRCTQIRQLVYIIAQGLPYKTFGARTSVGLFDNGRLKHSALSVMLICARRRLSPLPTRTKRIHLR